VPDPLERLLVVVPGTGGVADDGGIEPAIAGERYTEVDDRWPAVAQYLGRCFGGPSYQVSAATYG
jgi:hypothetical protein